ncbi:MAG: glutaredoxin [Blautia sp.]|nr:glutaredoxin [Blautia sp.]
MKLELFKYDTCPYCQRVMGEISASGRTDVEYCDIHKSEEALERLLTIGGKRQVPCLFIDGQPLYESGDIIAWLREHPQQA